MKLWETHMISHIRHRWEGVCAWKLVQALVITQLDCRYFFWPAHLHLPSDLMTFRTLLPIWCSTYVHSLKFKTLALVYRAAHQTDPPFLQSMVRYRTSSPLLHTCRPPFTLICRWDVQPGHCSSHPWSPNAGMNSPLLSGRTNHWLKTPQPVTLLYLTLSNAVYPL